MPLSIVTFMRSKSDWDGYVYKGMKYKQMDRWMSECNGGRRVRKHSDCKRVKNFCRFGTLDALVGMMMCLSNQVILVFCFVAFDGFCWNCGGYAVPCAYCSV